MNLPLHPFIVHFPVALAFILPVLALVVAVMIKKRKFPMESWFLIIGLQVLVTGFGYIALETGETEEVEVSKVLDKSLINKHEEAAEIFVGSTVIILALSVALAFLREDLQSWLQYAVVALSLISCGLAYKAGVLGAELVYRYGATAAYGKEVPASHVITPKPSGIILKSSDENESLKRDEFDYGNSDEIESEDGEAKQED